jgi:hypothetical protein
MQLPLRRIWFSACEPNGPERSVEQGRLPTWNGFGVSLGSSWYLTEVRWCAFGVVDRLVEVDESGLDGDAAIGLRAKKSDGIMFAWILVLASWVALLLLILHDATKDDSDGSAILIAAKSLGAFIEVTLKARKLRKVRSGTISKTPGIPPPKKKRWHKDSRVSITIPELELAIAEAVQKAAPDCEAFVGVIVRRTTPASRFDVNWRLQGIKFGNADRKIASEALTNIIERMQQEIKLTEH